jgi:choline-sulfatase
MKDIVMVLSDQHSFDASSLHSDGICETNNLSRIAQEGINYTNAYCNSPLCVPSRMSFLTGKLPSNTLIFDNDSALGSDIPTLAHALGARGYKTILVGRMHFKGIDQNHGFDERLVGDITSQYWGMKRPELSIYADSLKMSGCQKIMGKGYSPVHEYDNMVYEEALKQLSKEHDQPIFMIVGFYGPHFPYIGVEDLYEKYLNKKSLDVDYSKAYEEYEYLVQETSAEKRKKISSAYYSMCEDLDNKVGKIYDAYKNYLSEKDGLFIYTSDHGDQLGKRGLFGKITFYQDSIKIPLIIKEMNIDKSSVREDPVSLIDLSRTIVDYSNSHLPNMDGENILSNKKCKPVKIEQMHMTDNIYFGQCVISNNYKLTKLKDSYKLIHLANDSNEEIDIKNNEIEVFKQLQENMIDDRNIIDYENKHLKEIEILKAWGNAKKPEQTSMVAFSEEALQIERTLEIDKE